MEAYLKMVTPRPAPANTRPRRHSLAEIRVRGVQVAQVPVGDALVVPRHLQGLEGREKGSRGRSVGAGEKGFLEPVAY